MTETKHTPTPWRYERSRYGSIKGSKIISEETVIASLTPKADKPISQKIADAEFIVRACNAHDDLVSDKKHAIGVMKRAERTLAQFQYPDPIPPSNEWISKTRNMLLSTIKHQEAIIAKAKVQS